MDTKREARNDALKYAKAEMDYGEGAGIKRRHLKAKLESKFEDPVYKVEFEKALSNIDYDAIVRDIKAKKRAVNAKKNAKNAVKAAAIIGGLYSAYRRNKQETDEVIRRVTNSINIKRRKEDDKERAKAMEFINRKPGDLSDKEKARLYLKSKGIEWNPGAY